MKKLLALLLVVVSVLGLTACQKTIDDDQYSDYNQQNSGYELFEENEYNCTYTTYITQKVITESKTKSSVTESEYATPDKYLMNTYVQILTSNGLFEKMCKDMKIDNYTPSELKKMIKAEVVSDSYVIMITVSTDVEEDALKIANAHANVAPKYLPTIIKDCIMTIIDMPTAPVKVE